MKKRLVYLLWIFLLIGCQNNDQGTPALDADCACVPPPFKPLPADQIDAIVARMELFSELMSTLTPTSRVDMPISVETAATIIRKNCLLQYDEETNNTQTVEYVEAGDKEGFTCPLQYRTELRKPLVQKGKEVKGERMLNFKTSHQQIIEGFGIVSANLKGPYIRTQKRETREETIDTIEIKNSQDGSLQFLDLGIISARTIHQELKEFITASDGTRRYGKISLSRSVILNLKEGTAVFQWSLSSSEKGKNPLIQCHVNGTDISETRLCRNF